MFYGFVSDTFPIRGLRRKPYMLIGAIFLSVSYILLGILRLPNISLFSILLMWGSFGLVAADVSFGLSCVTNCTIGALILLALLGHG